MKKLRILWRLMWAEHFFVLTPNMSAWCYPKSDNDHWIKQLAETLEKSSKKEAAQDV